jgi:LPXTG-motif cell wall-anchored protein
MRTKADMGAMTKPSRARTVAGALALLLACTLSIGLLAGGTASAQSYPNVATLTADKPTVDPCDTVILTGTGYLPNSQVTITVNGTFAGTTMTDAQGNFTFPYPVPCNAAAGQLLFTASDGTTTLSTTVSVSAKATSQGGNSSNGSGSTGAATSSGSSLPTTGSNTDTYVRIAVLLIALGGLVLLATRRRDRHSVDA